MTAEEDDEKMLKTELNLAKKEGIQEGINQGIQQGIQQDRKELITKLFQKVKTIKEISELLDFDEKEIEQILN